jgi:hypothetical protein
MCLDDRCLEEDDLGHNSVGTSKGTIMNLTSRMCREDMQRCWEFISEQEVRHNPEHLQYGHTVFWASDKSPGTYRID